MSGLQYIERKTPLPAPINKPVGPLILSVHPGIGSYRIGITIDGLIITAGISLICSTTSASANDFVNAYVFGIWPRILSNGCKQKHTKNKMKRTETNATRIVAYCFVIASTISSSNHSTDRITLCGSAGGGYGFSISIFSFRWQYDVDT